MTMRDPDGSLEAYEKKIERCIYDLNDFPKDQKYTNDADALWHIHQWTLRDVVKYMLLRYGKGDQLLDIWNYLKEDGWPSYQQSVALIRNLPDPPIDERRRMCFVGLNMGNFINRDYHFFLAFLVFMDESPERLMNHHQWFSVDPPRRFLDVMFKSFIPDYQCAAKYQAGMERRCWTFPLMNALAQPPGQRSAALAAHMKNWHRLMRTFGWKPHRDPAPEKDGLFCYFAFEVAWAVCAYDIDDSSFRDHPHYPRDLVDYYRQHIRHTRDAWRAEGVGPGIELPPPSPPKRVDLAKSKRKNFARWVELACDGYDDDVESVLETTGKPRKVKEFYGLLEALQDANHAIHADLKDDDTVGIQAADLADARGIDPFEVPDSDPPHGPARCTATLRAFDAWVALRGYALIPLDDQGEDWHAVLVKTEYRDEFLALSHALGLRTPSAQQAYRDE